MTAEQKRLEVELKYTAALELSAKAKKLTKQAESQMKEASAIRTEAEALRAEYAKKNKVAKQQIGEAVMAAKREYTTLLSETKATLADAKRKQQQADERLAKIEETQIELGNDLSWARTKRHETELWIEQEEARLAGSQNDLYQQTKAVNSKSAVLDERYERLTEWRDTLERQQQALKQDKETVQIERQNLGNQQEKLVQSQADFDIRFNQLIEHEKIQQQEILKTKRNRAEAAQELRDAGLVHDKAEQLRKELETKLTMLNLTITNRKKALDAQEERLRKKEIQLADREKSLAKAFEEARRRGIL